MERVVVVVMRADFPRRFRKFGKSLLQAKFDLLPITNPLFPTFLK